MKTEFSAKVIAAVKKIPRGKVASYGQIAALAGKPHGSRGVAWILHSCSDKFALPWHRVVNSAGKISFPPDSPLFLRQKERLEGEGVEVGAKIDLKRFQWKKRMK